MAYHDGGLVVEFVGEDGRHRRFGVGELPLPGWHAPLAAAFAAAVGPAGTRRTLASAATTWGAVIRFVRFLAGLPSPPVVPQELTATQVDAFLRHRIDALGATWAWRELSPLRLIVRQPALRDLLSPAVLTYLGRRDMNTKKPGAPGYSDGEWARLVAAARADVAAIRDRIDAGERLVAAWSADPSSLSDPDQVVAAQLAGIARTGVVPRLPESGVYRERRARTAVAQQLLVTQADREPLLVLLGVVTGRNPETLKELPAEHRVLDRAAARSSCGSSSGGTGHDAGSTP
ncbi:hypothetical protein G7043_39835 [Lentzea sp. NEAU-D13]|uniref:Uncharacterized protein n=1 Tax=Lentzea alba TaxID=2714351 RepID=A0A7C9S0W6_9PSEU|nr:hypothetical protein [Lentzea alba]NGY65082.1 hypothetical protein [Lentzea alba]